jgi:hypothetical protein
MLPNANILLDIFYNKTLQQRFMSFCLKTNLHKISKNIPHEITTKKQQKIMMTFVERTHRYCIMKA